MWTLKNKNLYRQSTIAKTKKRKKYKKLKKHKHTMTGCIAVFTEPS